MIDQFHSLRDVQRMTGGKSRSTIYRWSRNGILPAPKKIGPNSIGWLKSELEDFFAKFQQGDSA
jgi:prophage regulatory protein